MTLYLADKPDLPPCGTASLEGKPTPRTKSGAKKKTRAQKKGTTRRPRAKTTLANALLAVVAHTKDRVVRARYSKHRRAADH